MEARQGWSKDDLSRSSHSWKGHLSQLLLSDSFSSLTDDETEPREMKWPIQGHMASDSMTKAGLEAEFSIFWWELLLSLHVDLSYNKYKGFAGTPKVQFRSADRRCEYNRKSLWIFFFLELISPQPQTLTFQLKVSKKNKGFTYRCTDIICMSGVGEWEGHVNSKPLKLYICELRKSTISLMIRILPNENSIKHK